MQQFLLFSINQKKKRKKEGIRQDKKKTPATWWPDKAKKNVTFPTFSVNCG